MICDGLTQLFIRSQLIECRLLDELNDEFGEGIVIVVLTRDDVYTNVAPTCMPN